MAIGNGGLRHEWFPEHSLMGTAKNEIRRAHRGRRYEEKSEYKRKYSGHEKQKSRLDVCNSGTSSG